MTREEIESMCYKAEQNCSISTDKVIAMLCKAYKVNEHIDEIYDYFESRTCENCKHWNGYCHQEENVRWFGIQFDTKHDFGCNKWEAKED